MDYTYYFYYRPFPLDCQCNSVKQSKINSTVASKDCTHVASQTVTINRKIKRICTVFFHFVR